MWRQEACKPGSVEIDHLSRLTVAGKLERVIFGLAGYQELSSSRDPFLAADRVYLFPASPLETTSFYLARFTVT